MESSSATVLLLSLTFIYLSHIPTVGGPSLPLVSYYGAYRFLFHADNIIHEGYTKYKGGLFKHLTLRGCHIILTSPELIEEVRKAPDDQLSFSEAANEFLQIRYTLGENVHNNPYHIPIVRSQLTRNIGALFSEICDEIVAAFDDEIPAANADAGLSMGDNIGHGNIHTAGWIKVNVRDAIMQIVCRTSNRIFVGLSLCRDPDYFSLNKTFTIDVVKKATTINMFPESLKQIVGYFLTDVPRSIDRGMKHLAPMISGRLRKMDEFGEDWTDRPWLMDEARGEERTVRALVLRVLVVNVSAIHTSSLSLQNIVCYLASNPQYIQPLREEVEACTQEDGWTEAALRKMRKIDSFVREVQRLTGLVVANFERKALKDYVFEDGTFVPAGTTIGAATHAIHLDEEFYPHPDVFDPPGRFFAVNELKAMLSHIVIMYDIKLLGGI
ncbi:cytochrome P450 [Wolfiporia cocos MD-104 SS10]|uniref:Cytochrome P450 n=1 Tax=Wolfiporia cocos (strain MD-104) TaxID=742152 RepID=A0A2H3JAY4_WOLCO|nr:cytochrome P450 [Wolfiporia cocos MD-104 SS10]